MFSLICVPTKDWANNRDAGDLKPHRAYYDVTVLTHLMLNIARHQWFRMIPPD